MKDNKNETDRDTVVPEIDSGVGGDRAANLATPGRRNLLLNAILIIALVAVALVLGKRIFDNMIPDVPGVMLTDVHTIEDLRSRFNQDQGAPRLVLLVSPT
jgi:hypothetical protein